MKEGSKFVQRKKNLVFINRYFFPDHSATSQILSDLVFSLGGSDYELQVLTSRQCYDDAMATLARKEDIRGVKVRRLWTSRFGRHWLPGRALDYLSFYLRVGVWLLLHVNAGDIVVSKTDPPLMSVVAAVIAKLRRGRLIIWNQDVYPEVASALGIRVLGGGLGRLLRRARNWSWQLAEVNVVLGDAMRRNLLAQNIPDENIHVVANWSDGSEIRPLDKTRNPLEKEWALANKFVIGYSGNMGRAHEFDTILQAAEALREHRDIVFLFIGNGKRRRWLEQEVERRRLSNVLFKPYQPTTMLKYSLSLPDVHLISLFPSLEGLIVPSKFYGIAAAGRPTLFVGDPDGEISRVLQERQCGLTVRTGDGAGLVKAILDLQADAAWRASLGANAREVFDTLYDKPLAINKWYNILYSKSA